MQSHYVITLPPSRRRRRPLFGQAAVVSPKRRFAAAAAVLAVGLPLAWAVVGILPSSTEDDTYVTASLNLPELPEATDFSVPATENVPLPPPLPATAPAELNIPPAAAPLPPVAERRTVTLKKGETLLGLLVEAAVPEAEAHEAMRALGTVYNPKVIQAGQDIDVIYNNGAFKGFEFEPSSERAVRVERQGQDYKAAAIDHPLERQVMAASAVIDTSLFDAGADAGIPNAAMVSMIKALSYSVDFQRDIHAGDSFKVLFETMRAPDGTLVKTGNILYAEMRLRGRTIPIYRYQYADGRVEYFDKTGKSLRKALLRTPVDGARVSSTFGMRRHPILGYSKMHKGMDFSAPTGTPIFAAGDGVVVERGWKNGYGNFIQIKHNGTISTAYAHMSRFNASISRGSRVKQGQVIGYVGTTGRSTGPHLHFELRVNGSPVNPTSIKNMNTGDALAGRDLNRFNTMVSLIEGQFRKVNDGQVVAVNFQADAKQAAATKTKAD